MSRSFPSSTPRLLLACVLSLLALTFAIEAKIAWYGPSVGPGSEVRAAKALPINTREMGVVGSLATALAWPQIPYILLVIFAVAALLATTRHLMVSRIAPEVECIPVASHFIPQTAFRPPPTR